MTQNCAGAKKYRRARFTTVIILAGHIVGCAGPATQRIAVDPQAAARETEIQREDYVRRQVRDQGRVQNIAAPLLTGNVDLCGKDVRPYIGMVAANVQQWPKDYQTAAAAALNMGDKIQVIHVVPGGPADLAGMKPGDIIPSIGSQPAPEGKGAAEKFLNLQGKILQPGVETVFHVLRDGDAMDLGITPTTACAYKVALTASDEVNAFADGDNIFVTSGMLRFTESDVELATVLGHELAHDAMGHMDKKKTNYLLGSIFDVVAAAYGVNTQGAFGNMGAQTFSQDFEAEADYVGLYALANGGYDISEAPAFWRRMGANHPGSVKTTFQSSHPGTAERYLALEQTVAEINTKKQEGSPLRPALKNEKKKAEQH